MSEHRPTIRPVPVPEWVLHQPVCSCGWEGDILRTRRLAQDQADEHLDDEHPDPEIEQIALF